jgi:hypothetical protein
MFFPDMHQQEEEEYLFESTIRNSETMSSEFDSCILGQSKDGLDIYSWKKMLKVVMSFDLDEYEAEDFLFRTSNCFPADTIILMDN